jgi:hypothetical protein
VIDMTRLSPGISIIFCDKPFPKGAAPAKRLPPKEGKLTLLPRKPEKVPFPKKGIRTHKSLPGFLEGDWRVMKCVCVVKFEGCGLGFQQ